MDFRSPNNTRVLDELHRDTHANVITAAVIGIAAVVLLVSAIVVAFTKAERRTIALQAAYASKLLLAFEVLQIASYGTNMPSRGLWAPPVLAGATNIALYWASLSSLYCQSGKDCGVRVKKLIDATLAVGWAGMFIAIAARYSSQVYMYSTTHYPYIVARSSFLWAEYSLTQIAAVNVTATCLFLRNRSASGRCVALGLAAIHFFRFVSYTSTAALVLDVDFVNISSLRSQLASNICFGIYALLVICTTLYASCVKPSLPATQITSPVAAYAPSGSTSGPQRYSYGEQTAVEQDKKDAKAKMAGDYGSRVSEDLPRYDA